jgi:hypothetical protein
MVSLEWSLSGVVLVLVLLLLLVLLPLVVPDEPALLVLLSDNAWAAEISNAAREA